ncbi:MAG: hypothetical protein V3T58_04375 [Candidatus Hydrothermarchaeales archaeon]
MGFNLVKLGVVLLLVSTFFGEAYAIVTWHVSGWNYEFDVDFNEPRGTKQYTIGRTIVFYNSDENYSVSIPSLAATTDIDGFTVELRATSINIDPETTKSVDATFHVAPNMTEGTHKGKLRITGANVSTSPKSVTVDITWPNPAITAVWDQRDWGKLKAGSAFKQRFIVNETMGYHLAENVSLRIGNIGSAALNYSGALGDILPFGSKRVTVDVEVPERNLEPGTYSVTPRLSSTNITDIDVEDAAYAIPMPVLELDNHSMAFGDITFEAGRDASLNILTVKESGGYTPVEDINLTLSSGEGGWITYTQIDYLPRNSSKILNFILRLPPEASLGDKKWEFTIDTLYAGSHKIEATTTVYFPGIEDALIDLQNATVLNVTESKIILDNSLLLLQNSRGATEIRKIAMVMSVYSGTRSILNLMKEAKDSKATDLDRAGSAIILAENALNKIKIGDENIEDESLKQYTTAIAQAADSLWRSNAVAILSLISDRAEASKDSDYKTAAIYYKRGKKIYSLLGDTEAENEYLALQTLKEEEYRESLTRAIKLKSEGAGELEVARAKMFGIGNVYFVLNPFAYDLVSQNYRRVIEKYTDARELFEVAGERDDAELLSREVVATVNQEQTIRIGFLVYGLFWTVLFVGFIARVSLGLQYFKQDEEDTYIGEVVLPEER